MALELSTLLLIQLNIASEKCKVCGHSASRMKRDVKRGEDNFYCTQHYPVDERKKHHYTIPQVRDHSPKKR